MWLLLVDPGPFALAHGDGQVWQPGEGTRVGVI